MCKGKVDVVWVHARAASERMIALLRTAPARHGTVRGFLEELDRRIVCAEMTDLAVRNVKTLGKRPPPIADVLYRAPSLFVGRLDDRAGSLAFLGKLGKGWTWAVGSADDVLANVPDARLEAASEAVLGVNAARPRPPPR